MFCIVYNMWVSTPENSDWVIFQTNSHSNPNDAWKEWFDIISDRVPNIIGSAELHKIVEKRNKY